MADGQRESSLARLEAEASANKAGWDSNRADTQQLAGDRAWLQSEQDSARRELDAAGRGATYQGTPVDSAAVDRLNAAQQKVDSLETFKNNCDKQEGHLHAEREDLARQTDTLRAELESLKHASEGTADYRGSSASRIENLSRTLDDLSQGGGAARASGDTLLPGGVGKEANTGTGMTDAAKAAADGLASGASEATGIGGFAGALAAAAAAIWHALGGDNKSPPDAKGTGVHDKTPPSSAPSSHPPGAEHGRVPASPDPHKPATSSSVSPAPPKVPDPPAAPPNSTTDTAGGPAAPPKVPGPPAAPPNSTTDTAGGPAAPPKVPDPPGAATSTNSSGGTAPSTQGPDLPATPTNADTSSGPAAPARPPDPPATLASSGASTAPAAPPHAPDPPATPGTDPPDSHAATPDPASPISTAAAEPASETDDIDSTDSAISDGAIDPRSEDGTSSDPVSNEDVATSDMASDSSQDAAFDDMIDDG